MTPRRLLALVVFPHGIPLVHVWLIITLQLMYCTAALASIQHLCTVSIGIWLPWSPAIVGMVVRAAVRVRV